MAINLDIKFDKETTITWLIPGYHVDWSKKIGSLAVTQDGKKASITGVELQVKWNQLSPAERRWLKKKYDLNVKYKYHQFTRVTLTRLLPVQLTFPEIDWTEPNFDPQW